MTSVKSIEHYMSIINKLNEFDQFISTLSDDEFTSFIDIFADTDDYARNSTFTLDDATIDSICAAEGNTTY